MATFRGVDGDLTITASSVAELQSWELNIDRPEHETTAMLATAGTYTLDIPNATASAQVNLDYGDTAQAALISQAIAGTVPTALAAVFKVATGKTFSGNVLVRGATIAAQRGSLITLNLNLRVTGAITVAWA